MRPLMVASQRASGHLPEPPSMPSHEARSTDGKRIGPDPRELSLPSSAHSGSEVGETPGITPSVDKAHAENIGGKDRTSQGS